MIRNTTIFAAALALSVGVAFAKAHDQGVADGTQPAVGTGELIQSLGGNGLSGGINKGQRGAAASSAKGDNATEPVVGNGANADD